MAKVLVVGGAGYVGSAAAAWLIDQGHEAWILDDLSTGLRELVLGPRFVQARAGDGPTVLALAREHRFDCAMHFAARSLVGESMRKPLEYHENNVVQTRILVEALLEAGVRNVIFSSTCAIFGDPGGRAISEDLPQKPVNPYGETKLGAERILQELAARQGLRAVALRYFNAAGAEPKLRVGELHHPESHLIPNVLRAAAEGREVQVFGTDYPTPDGTCIRDYVHVTDLARAHEAAMSRLLARGPDSAGTFEAFNLGSANGFSVREVIAAAERVTGRKIRVQDAPRRPGDPPRLVADSARARKELGFRTSGEGSAYLDSILESAWNWERKARQARKAVFLDRDGTLNQDPGYLSRPEQLQLLPGVGEALARLRVAGYLLVVVSNQSGVGRGLIRPEEIPRIGSKLDELLAESGAWIDHAELCFHRPEEECECRKPRPRLLQDAAAKLRVDLSRSYMIGDKISDLGAGAAAGCKGSILVRTGEGRTEEARIRAGQASFVADDLRQAAEWILGQG